MKKISIKIATILLIPLVLTGCLGFGGGDEEGAITELQAGEILYEDAGFSITLPADWEIIRQGEFTSNVPLETIVAFRNNIKNEIFTANIVISKDNIQEGLSAADFAKSSTAKNRNSLVGFEQISESQYQEENTYLTVFEGKKSSSDPVVHFQQLHVVDGETGYLVTAGYLPNEEESVVKILEEMLDSFALK